MEEKKGLAFTVVMICMKMLLTEKEKERENLFYCIPLSLFEFNNLPLTLYLSIIYTSDFINCYTIYHWV